MTYGIQKAMDEILLFGLTQAVVESSTADISFRHLKPVTTMLAVGETGWPDIMFQCIL